jgi:malonyl-CoA O-methyltransferase
MPDTPGAGPIMEIGCGTGLLTRRLAAVFPTTVIHALDVSGRMIGEAARRLPPYARVSWIEADVRDYSSPHTYSAIVSSSSLHWIEPLDETLSAVGALTGPGGTFVAAFMLRDTLRELHAARRHAAPGKEPVARLADLDAILEILEALGWRILATGDETLAERHANAGALLRSLHDRGVTGGAVSRSRNPLTRGDLNRLRSYYDAHYRLADGGVKATYHVGWIKAEKA